MRRPVLFAILAVSLVVAGCAGATSGTPAGAPATSPATTQATTPAAPGAAPSRGVARGGANVILNSEIEAAGEDVRNAYELIERLRPTMLRPRNLSAGAGETYGIVTYLEDVRLGELEQLKNVMRATVYEIRYINATDATTRWGTGHSNGVILVRLKR